MPDFQSTPSAPNPLLGNSLNTINPVSNSGTSIPDQTIPPINSNPINNSIPSFEQKPPAVPPVPPVPPTPPVNSKVETFLTEDSNRFPLKKILLVFLIILFVIGGGFALWKFVLPTFKSAEPIELTYWGLWEDEASFNQVATEYQTTHPNVKINYVRQSQKDYRERLQSALAKEEAPDIFRYHNTWVPMLKNELSPVPDNFLTEGTFETIFYPTVVSDLKTNNSYLGVPLEFDGLGLFVNVDLFKEKNLSYPKTWDELRKTALNLVVKDAQGNIQIGGVALGRTENVDHWSDILGLMMLQNGADLANPSGSLAEDALTYFTLFSQVDNVWDETLPTSTMAFANGKLAMYFGPSWRVFEIKKINPNLNFEIIPVPQLLETNVTWASYWVEGVSRKSEYQKEAWEFLQYLSSKNTLENFYQISSKTRLFGEPYSRTDMADKLFADQYVGAYLKQAPTAKSWYLASRTYDNGINEKIIKYYEDAVNGVNQGKSASDALNTASQGIAQVLAQYGISASVTR